jgi:hypothetical protein
MFSLNKDVSDFTDNSVDFPTLDLEQNPHLIPVHVFFEMKKKYAPNDKMVLLKNPSNYLLFNEPRLFFTTSLIQLPPGYVSYFFLHQSFETSFGFQYFIEKGDYVPCTDPKDENIVVNECRVGLLAATFPLEDDELRLSLHSPSCNDITPEFKIIKAQHLILGEVIELLEKLPLEALQKEKASV